MEKERAIKYSPGFYRVIWEAIGGSEQKSATIWHTVTALLKTDFKETKDMSEKPIRKQ